MKESLKKVSEYEFETGNSKIFISERLLKDVEDMAIQQLISL